MVFSPCTKELENFAARCVVLLLYLQCVQKKKRPAVVLRFHVFQLIESGYLIC